MAIPVLESGFRWGDSVGSTVTSISSSTIPGIKVGELLIAAVMSDSTSDNPQFTGDTNMSAYTKLGEAGTGTADCHVGVFWKIADGTEDSITMLSADSNELAFFYFRVSSVNTTTPIEDWGFHEHASLDSTETIVFSDSDSHVTSADADSLFIFVGATDGADLVQMTGVTAHPDYTNETLVYSFGVGSGNDVGAMLGSARNPNTGLIREYCSFNHFDGNSDGTAAMTLVINPGPDVSFPPVDMVKSTNQHMLVR